MTAKKTKRAGGGRKPVVSLFGHHMHDGHADDAIIKPRLNRLVKTPTGYKLPGKGGHR